MPNRLEKETSPYLLQHKDNPVDWYPWCEEAFERAKIEDKPVFLSVGYSACHWCHVMAHESFEDEETARIMNELFVNIKVDREERPDVDQIYMGAVQALTGRGGWPMSVWLLPDGRPFFGGTYFPPAQRHGMPSFRQVLTRIHDIYRQRRDHIEKDATRLTQAISGSLNISANDSAEALSPDILDSAYEHIAQRYDPYWGGFGSQPKFPPSMTLELLLRTHLRTGEAHALDMVTYTLDKMAAGGMYDQLGGGFHRYSVDEKWLVPHFEKMLYDNALLSRIYLTAFLVTGNPNYRKVVEETFTYVLREMTDPEGAFYSSQDADSEGEEGKYFVWEEQELRNALSEHDLRDAVLDYWGVMKGANFEGKHILWAPESIEDVAARNAVSVDQLETATESAKRILLAEREGRVKPGRDDKIITSWNGLMIFAFAQAGRCLNRPEYVNAASRAAEFVLANMMVNGKLRRTYKDGRARFNAYLEDHAFLAEGLLELYQATFDVRWFNESKLLVESIMTHFWDDAAGFYDTPHDHEELITRPQDVSDNAVPSGTSSALAACVRIGALTGADELIRRSKLVMSRLSRAVSQYASAFAYTACQIDFLLSSPHEIALVGPWPSEKTQTLIEILYRSYRPNQVVALSPIGINGGDHEIPLLHNRTFVDGKPAAYVCRNFVCSMPATSPEELENILNAR